MKLLPKRYWRLSAICSTFAAMPRLAPVEAQTDRSQPMQRMFNPTGLVIAAVLVAAFGIAFVKTAQMANATAVDHRIASVVASIVSSVASK
jgi:hypothetical protein